VLDIADQEPLAGLPDLANEVPGLEEPLHAPRPRAQELLGDAVW